MKHKKIRPTHWQIDSLNQPLSEKITSRYERKSFYFDKNCTDSKWNSNRYFIYTKSSTKFTHQSGGGVVIQTPLYEEVA